MDMLKFSKRCLQRTDAALQVSVWDVWGCQSIFAKKTYFHRTDALRFEFICTWKIGTKMIHIQIWSVNSSTFALYFSNFVMCAFYGLQLYLTSFSSIQTQSHCSPFFPFHMVLAGGSRPGAPHHRCHPETPGGGPAPPSSCRARSAPRCESSAHADLHEQPCHAPGAAGEAEWGWAEVFGWREVTFLEDASHFWFDQGLRPAFSSCFPVLLKRCDQWFIYAIIYHCCRVFCLYMYLLLFPTPPDHVPTLGKISWKYSIVTLYHTLKRVHQTWRISRFTIPAGNCVASEVTNRIVLPT